METFLILFLVIVAPVWIVMHYTSKRREDRQLTPDDERMLEDLWRSAKAMERRLQALESITDTEPKPRSAAHGARPGPADSVM